MSHRRSLLATIALNTAQCAMAQNLLQNSQFDSSLDPWTASANAIWTNSEDHTHGADAAVAGSVLIAALNSEQEVAQCVATNANTRYLLSAWVRRPSFSFDPCEAKFTDWQVKLEWNDAGACQGQTIGTLKTNNASIPADTWVYQSLTGITPTTSASAKITLSATCSAANQEAAFYFDDVTFTTDQIFKDDFDQAVVSE